MAQGQRKWKAFVNKVTVGILLMEKNLASELGKNSSVFVLSIVKVVLKYV